MLRGIDALDGGGYGNDGASSTSILENAVCGKGTSNQRRAGTFRNVSPVSFVFRVARHRVFSANRIAAPILGKAVAPAIRTA
jgi:hypothetical protein